MIYQRWVGCYGFVQKSWRLRADAADKMNSPSHRDYASHEMTMVDGDAGSRNLLLEDVLGQIEALWLGMATDPDAVIHALSVASSRGGFNVLTLRRRCCLPVIDASHSAPVSHLRCRCDSRLRRLGCSRCESPWKFPSSRRPYRE